MDDDLGMAARFEAGRERLAAVAYRMPGSWVEAEDAVQEAWLRLIRAEEGRDTRGVANFEGWLTTVVARVCLDVFRGRRRHGESPLDGQPPGALALRDDRCRPAEGGRR